jgi:hypothetical protein
VHSFEFQTFASMHGHDPHRIHMECRGRNLAKITLFREQDELPHTIQDLLDRQPRSRRGLLADEVEELPDGNGPHPIGDGFATNLLPK